MKRFLPLALVSAGTLFLIASLTGLSIDRAVSNPAPVALPEQIAGVPLTDKLTGAQAASEFARLHGRQFVLTSGAVGTYGNGRITLWVAGPPLEVMAARMVLAMREKIAEGNSPFRPMAESQDDKRTIYILEGMGQRHFYFQSGNLVIWLAADAHLADTALQEIQEYYP